MDFLGTIATIILLLAVLCLSRTVYLIDTTRWRPKPQDVTVILPTIGLQLDSVEFTKCITSILANHPLEVLIAIVGPTAHAGSVCAKFHNPAIRVVSVAETNKRRKFLEAAKTVCTQIVCYADDHSFWPPTFLRSALVPFADPKVGLLGNVKRVIRDRSGNVGASFLNYLACIYSERYNFECTATYNLDSGAFAISSRTALSRTEIIHSKEFQDGYLHEHRWCGDIEPLKVDDDNFITRYMVKKGYKIVFWNQPDALMMTTLEMIGGWDKFRGQLMRWARTTYRSNLTSLLVDRVCWRCSPWTTSAMFITSFFNTAVYYDLALFWSLYKATGAQYLHWLTLVLLATKLIKPLPHLMREPQDISFWFGGVIFGYFHSLMRVWTFFTAGNSKYMTDSEWSQKMGKR